MQAGLDSTPFPGGRVCYRFEESLHRFQNMIIDRMVGKRRVPPGDESETVPMFTPGGLIFDCDGTLADTMPAHFEAWTAVLQRLSMP